MVLARCAAAREIASDDAPADECPARSTVLIACLPALSTDLVRSTCFTRSASFTTGTDVSFLPTCRIAGKRSPRPEVMSLPSCPYSQGVLSFGIQPVSCRLRSNLACADFCAVCRPRSRMNACLPCACSASMPVICVSACCRTYISFVLIPLPASSVSMSLSGALRDATLPACFRPWTVFSMMRPTRRTPPAAMSSIRSPPYASRCPRCAVSRNCVRSRSALFSKPRWTSSLGVAFIFSRTEEAAFGFSLILSIVPPPRKGVPHYTARPSRA